MKRLLSFLVLLLTFVNIQAQTVGENIDVTHYEIHLWGFDFTNRTLQGEAFVDFIAFCSPEAIILFGGLAHAGDLLFEPIRKTVDANVMPIFKGKCKLLMSELKDADAAVLGASALGWELKDLDA